MSEVLQKIKPLPMPTTSEMVDALDELVSTLLTYRFELKAKRTGLPEFISATVWAETPREVSKARDLVFDPIDISLKRGLKDVAQLIYDAVGMDRLEDILEEVCDRDPRRERHRRAILASAFNGVGKKDDRWWS